MQTYPKDKVKGALYGLVIGDAMGTTTEFLEQSDIKKRFKKRTDIIGKGWLNLYAGEATDPTDVAFCICDAIETSREYRSTPKYKKKLLNQCCQNYVAWYYSYPFDKEECHRHVIELCKDKDYTRWSVCAYDPRGCGNDNLFAAVPLILSRHSLRMVLDAGLLTHNSPLCHKELKRFRDLLLDCLHERQLTNQVFNQLPPRHRNIKATIDSALYHLETTATFETAILEAVYHGGDTDAIAALVGTLAGAFYGYHTIPKRWIDQLLPEYREKLDHYAEILSYIGFPDPEPAEPEKNSE